MQKCFAYEFFENILNSHSLCQLLRYTKPPFVQFVISFPSIFYARILQIIGHNTFEHLHVLTTNPLCICINTKGDLKHFKCILICSTFHINRSYSNWRCDVDFLLEHHWVISLVLQHSFRMENKTIIKWWRNKKECFRFIKLINEFIESKTIIIY